MSGEGPDGSWEPSGLSTLVWGGYEEFLGEHDSGTWASMLEPGASGFGLLLAFHMPHLCCHDASGYMSTRDDDEVPVLLPIPVAWHSVISEATGLVDSGIVHDWGQNLIPVPVGLTDCWWPDEYGYSRMAVVNSVAGDDWYGEDSWYRAVGLGAEGAIEIQGLVAPWQIMPITKAAFADIKASVIRASQSYHTHALNFGNCDQTCECDSDQDYFADDPEDYIAQHDESPHDHVATCHYDLGDEFCSCGHTPCREQEMYAAVEALMSRRLTGEDFLPQAYWPLWEYAQRAYVHGLGITHDLMTQGDPWFTSYWRRLSPFSGSASLEALLRRLSPVSTSSPTPQASSPESSLLSTRYAS